MILPTFLVLPLVGAVLVMLHLRARPDPPAVWRAALRLGLALGAARALFVAACWWSAEHGPGALQIFGYFVFVGWPEILLVPRSTRPLPASGYGIVVLVEAAGSVAWLCLFAALEVARRRFGGAPAQKAPP